MEAEVIRFFYSLGEASEMTLEEIGNIFSLTRERMQQIKEKVLWRIRRVSNQTNLQT